jgi:putative heme-binding domain-containing protein
VRFQPAPTIQIDSKRLAEVALKDGDAAHGRSLFFSDKATCGKCHRFKREGGRVGPDLTNSARRLGRRGLIESILYPDASILTGYETWTIVDTNGRSQSGLLISTGEEIVVRSADGRQNSVPRNEVDELIRHSLSLMPGSLGKALSTQDIADLVAFLHDGF